MQQCKITLLTYVCKLYVVCDIYKTCKFDLLGKKLIILTGICGSAYAAVELCNSRAFGLGIFNMGLTEMHLRAFHSTRIYSTIMCENIPQLIIQLWYLHEQNKFDVIVTWSFISSIVSIFIAIVDVYSTMSLVRAMKMSKKQGFLNGQSYSFELIGDCIVKHRSMRKLFASIIEVDQRCVELNLCVKTTEGLQFGFTVYAISNNDKHSRFKRLMQIYESSCIGEQNFIEGVIDVWDINQIDEYSIQGHKIGKSDIRIVNMAIFYNTNSES